MIGKLSKKELVAAEESRAEGDKGAS